MNQSHHFKQPSVPGAWCFQVYRVPTAPSKIQPDWLLSRGCYGGLKTAKIRTPKSSSPEYRVSLILLGTQLQAGKRNHEKMHLFGSEVSSGGKCLFDIFFTNTKIIFSTAFLKKKIKRSQNPIICYFLLLFHSLTKSFGLALSYYWLSSVRGVQIRSSDVLQVFFEGGRRFASLFLVKFHCE